MAEHVVRVEQVPEVEILNKDLVVAVDSDGEAFGRLTISRGGIGWYPKSAPIERALTWEQFDRLIRKEFPT